MKKSLGILLFCTLACGSPAGAYNYGSYSDDNPFVEAMLRMMELFGLVDRSRLPLGVPYLPGYAQNAIPGIGGLGGYPGLGGLSGFSPMQGMGAVPGLSPPYGMGQLPGGLGWPGGAYPQSGGLPNPWAGQRWGDPARSGAPSGLLDGIWEINKGGFVIIRGNAARLYVSQERYQDFVIGYDRRYLWWRPKSGGGGSSRYRYQLRDGRMIMQDDEGNYLLLRRRR